MSMKLDPRKYELKKRAERQDETRQRIVEATVALHEELGPAQTSISAIAERAGVGRPTVYRHFPDERSLFTACTTHYNALHQPPDPTGWRRIADPEERMRSGLLEVYRWYRDTERMMTVAARDLAQLPVLAEVLEPQRAWLSEAHAILTDGWPAPFADTLRAVVGHALAFATWRSLARDFGLPDETVADLMTALVVSAARRGVPAPANGAIVAT
jgi:AcrR family transcriptional regulator